MPRFENGLTEAEVTQGFMPIQPRIHRQISGTVALSTAWARLDLATNNANTFSFLGAEQVVDWNVTDKLFTFNDGTTRNYIAALNAKITTTGIVAPPLAAPVYAQFRFIVPDGVSPGVDFFFPFSTGDGFMDLQEVAYVSSMRHQQLTPVTADAAKRTNGVGCEMRLSAAPLTGTVTLAYFAIYMFGA